jgi:hypothetical protein
MEIWMTKVQKIGVPIKGINFDGLASNTAMADLLGYTTDVEDIVDIVPYFKFNDEYICVCNSEWKYNKIEWKYIKKLHDLQEKGNMKLGNKLNTMKVKLATQLLSKSVADGLQFCSDVLKLHSFKDC